MTMDELNRITDKMIERKGWVNMCPQNKIGSCWKHPKSSKKDVTTAPPQ